MMSVVMALQITFNLALIATCGYALVRGDGPEVLGSLINLSACLVTWASQAVRMRHWETFDATVFAIDVAVAIGFFELAARSTRYWPIWCFAFALDDLFVQAARILTPGIDTIAYASISATIWAYLALLALAIGTARASTLRREFRDDTPWVKPSGSETTLSSLWSAFRARISRGWRTR